MIKDIVYNIISGVGYRYTPSAYVNGLELSYHLRQIFASLKISCVVDVGANEGQFRNFLRRRCGYKGLILSFEPVKPAFDFLQIQAKNDPKWLVYNCALGAETGRMRFNIMRDTQFSSFLQPQSADVDKPDIEAKNVIVRQEEVAVYTLSDALADISSKRTLGAIYLKLDTQGYDFHVIRGAGRAFANVVALQTEVPVKILYKDMVSFSSSIEQLGQYGFEITGLFPIGRDRLQRVIEFDCVAVRTSSGGA